MKQKHLESCLSSLPNRVFPSPKIELEQYPTSVPLASSVVLSALERGDAGPGTSILDIGCGTGMLGLGFALVQSDMVRQIDFNNPVRPCPVYTGLSPSVGANGESASFLQVYLVDCDSDALELARENLDMLVEKDLIGRSNEDEEGGCGCLGVELIMAKVNYVPPKRRNNEGGGGRVHRGARCGRGGREKKEKDPEAVLPSSTSQDGFLYAEPNDNMNDGIPLHSKIVDTVITK
jgi:hypothetical protein